MKALQGAGLFSGSVVFMVTWCWPGLSGVVQLQWTSCFFLSCVLVYNLLRNKKKCSCFFTPIDSSLKALLKQQYVAVTPWSRTFSGDLKLHLLKGRRAKIPFFCLVVRYDTLSFFSSELHLPLFCSLVIFKEERQVNWLFLLKESGWTSAVKFCVTDGEPGHELNSVDPKAST